MSDLLYKRLKRFDACSEDADYYKGKSMIEAWNDITSVNDFFWLLSRLKDVGMLSKHPTVEDRGRWKKRVYNAYYFADPHDKTRRHNIRKDKECITALKTLFTFRQVSRALAKIKV